MMMAALQFSQRTWQIWSFAFVFFFKYWLVGKKWAYGKAGMTAGRVVERKATLAIWLREGLVKLGPTFIKARTPSPKDHNETQSRASALGLDNRVVGPQPPPLRTPSDMQIYCHRGEAEWETHQSLCWTGC